MDATTIVSVTDGKIGNINASLVFFHNLFELCPALGEVFLLTIDGQIPRLYVDYFKQLGVEVIAYDMPHEVMNGDPYRVKYLLSYFASDLLPGRQNVLYLDPDHMVQHELHLDRIGAQNREIVVSSEIRSISALEAMLIGGRHCNTSLLYTNVKTLRSVCEAWLQEYEAIRKTVDVRNREEIAMMIAAEKKGFKFKPCEITMQCGIDTYRQESTLCHYGGQSTLSIDLKKILNSYDYDEMICNLDRYHDPDNVLFLNALVEKIRKYIMLVRDDFA